MGIFDFVKSVGKKLGFGDEETPPTAEDLKAELDSYNLGSEKLTVEIVGDKAVIKGEVADQSIFEKAIIAVGNTLGVSKVEASEIKFAATPDVAPKDVVLHEVKKGDSLWKIAAKHYDNGSKYPVIFEANKPMLSDPDKIYPGQMLRIPSLDDA